MDINSKKETPLQQSAEVFSSSFPIRAPITIDSDSEDFLSSNDNGGKKFSISSYGSDYSGGGYLTGEDNEVVLGHGGSVVDDEEFNDDVSRPFVKNPDGEMSEGSSFSEEFVVSRPFVKDPDDEMSEGSSFSEEFVVSRPFVTDPDDEIVVESSHVEEIDVRRPFGENPNGKNLGRSEVVEELVGTRPIVKILDEEDIVEEGQNVDEFGVSLPFVRNPVEEIVEMSNHVEPAVIDVGDLSPPKLGIPIAVLSGYSDDDSIGSEVEDDGFVGGVSVPSADVVENAISAPKVRVSTLDEGEDDEFQFEDSVSDEDVSGYLRSDEEKGNAEKDSISGVDINGVLDSAEEKGMAGKVSVKDSNIAEVVKNEGLEFQEAANDECLGATNDFETPLVEDVQAFERAEQESQLDFGDTVISPVKSNVMTQVVQSNLAEIGLEISEVDGDVNLGGVILDIGSCDIHGGAFSEEVICRQGTEDDKLHREVKLISEKGLDCHDSVIPDSTVEPIEWPNSESDSVVEVDQKDEADYLKTLTEDVESSLLDDNVIYGDSETTVERSERKVDIHDSVSYSSMLDPVSSLNPSSGSQMKPDDTDGADFPGLLPEVVERSISIDKAEGLISGDPETLTQISESSTDSHDSHIHINTLEPEVKVDDKDEAYFVPKLLSKEVESSLLDDKSEGLVFGDSKTMVELLGELEQKFKHPQSSQGSSHDDFSEKANDVGETEGKGLLDSVTLDALLKAMAGTSGASSTFPSVRPTPDANSAHLFTPSELYVRDESKEILSEEEERKLEKLQQIRVKFLRLVQRLGLSTDDSIATQVLRRLVLASGRLSSQLFNLESAIRAAKEIEAEAKNELNFSLNILVIGKTGVGKSATINSLFGQSKALTNAFHPATTTVKQIVGKIDGVEVRVLDTPGLRSSLSDESFNQKILLCIKKFTKKFPPDVVLYVDRVDTQSQDPSDFPLFKKITSTLGQAVWRNSVIVLTHAASTPPDGLFGSPLSFEGLVSQQSRAIQQMICYAIGEMNILNPVVPVENHPLCKKNEAGQIVLPDGQSWIPQLLLLCYSTKILSEANSLVKASKSLGQSKLFEFIGRRKSVLQLPYFVTSLLQSFTHPKLERDYNADRLDSDLNDFDQEDDDEYDQLPPFKPLSKVQFGKLSKEQKKAYLDEFDYCVKLLKKKQWREDLKRLKEEVLRGKDGADMEDGDHEGPADVTVPLPDMAIPLSFDSDDPSYRYRFLEQSSQLLTRPVLDAQVWDHDIGYGSVSLKQILEIANSFPAEISVQMTKDKKEFRLNMDSAVSAKHGVKGSTMSTMAGLEIQSMGEQLAYILKGETKMKTYKLNETAAGVSVTFLGENVVPGFKLEDRLAVRRGLVLTGSTGITRSQGDNAYGVKLEGQIKEKDFPIGQDQSSFGLTLVQWRGDLVWVCNFQSEFSVGRSSKLCLNAGLNNKGNGKFSVRINSSEQLKVAILGLLPIANTICRNVFHSSAKGT